MSFNAKLNRAIVITSINYPTTAIKKLSQIEGWNLIVVSDLKTPLDWKCKDADFLSIERQNSLQFKIAKLIPYNHYSRKNIGYLYAISKGANLLYETDDDNVPYDFWSTFCDIEIQAKICSKPGTFLNIYSYFTNENIWPRGLPFKFINNRVDMEINVTNVIAPVQQGLADFNPDIDAVCRFVYKKNIFFLPNSPLFIPPKTFCPFNSQNTLWYKEAFQYLFLPVSLSSRVTDIWRGYIAQHFLHRNNQGVLFCRPSVIHIRNKHNLIQDFNEELKMYLYTIKFVNVLKMYTGSFVDVMDYLYEHSFVKKIDVTLFQAWISDLQDLGLYIN